MAWLCCELSTSFPVRKLQFYDTESVSRLSLSFLPIRGSLKSLYKVGCAIKAINHPVLNLKIIVSTQTDYKDKLLIATQSNSTVVVSGLTKTLCCLFLSSQNAAELARLQIIYDRMCLLCRRSVNSGKMHWPSHHSWNSFDSLGILSGFSGISTFNVSRNFPFAFDTCSFECQIIKKNLSRELEKSFSVN